VRRVVRVVPVPAHQRDRKVYGETADAFVPERWVGDTDTSSASRDEDDHATGASEILSAHGGHSREDQGTALARSLPTWRPGSS
jgi:cytochrome P450